MNLDKSIVEFITSHRNPLADWFFVLLSHLGDMMIIWFVLGVVLVIRNKKYQLIYHFILSGIGMFVVNSLILKQLFKRDRPFVTNTNIIPLVHESSYSFPSGHSSSSFLAAVLLSHHFPKYRIFFYSLAFLIAFSRVYVGVHYLSDVVVGAIVGALFAKLVIVLEDRLISKKQYVNK